VVRVGTIALLFCIPAVLLAPWINLPFPCRLNGAAFVIVGPYGGYSNSAIAWISFGALSAVLLVFAAIASILRQAACLCAAGALLIVLAYWAFLHLALGDAALLFELARGSDWARAAIDFTNQYISPGIATEPSAWLALAFDTVQDRLVSAWYFLGLGWYVVVVSGMSIFCVGIRSINARSARRATWLTSLCLTVLTCSFALRPLAAQWSLAEAVSIAGDSAPRAMELYHRAIDLDGWYAHDLRLYERIGALDAQLGRKSTTEFDVYYAEALVSWNENVLAKTQPTLQGLRSAVAIYDKLAEHGPICALARMRSVELMTEYGLRLFTDGAFGSAVYAWRQALIRDPDMWLAKFYLSRGYLVVGDYQRAVDEAQRLIIRTSDPVLRSMLLVDLGDAETQLGDLESAHLAYYESYFINYNANRRGLASLIGE